MGSGGNRIVHMADTMGSRAGLDLVVEKKGELVLGVNAYPDVIPGSQPSRTRSPPTRKSKPDNWRFFAVTYDATAATEQVRFYLGDARRAAELDRSRDVRSRPVGTSYRTVDHRCVQSDHSHRQRRPLFRGLIDDIRVFGSATDGAGALHLEQIRNIQRGQVD